jgi:hypothetical protein
MTETAEAMARPPGGRTEGRRTAGGFLSGKNLIAGKKENGPIEKKKTHQHPVNEMCRSRNHPESYDNRHNGKINQRGCLELGPVEGDGSYQQSNDQ